MKKLLDFLKTDSGLTLLAFAAVALLLLISLGADGLPAAQEGRTALIVRKMLTTGNPLDMDIPLTILYEKPIGHYWLCLPFAWLFGIGAAEPANSAFVEWGVRLPSAISALAALVAVLLLARRIYGTRIAALSVFVTGSMLTFLHLGRLAHIDMPLAAAFAWSMYFLYAGYLEEWKSNWKIYGFYIVLGWGMILKGPLVLILSGLIVLAMMIWKRRWRMLWEIRPISGGALFLLTALPWYVYETIRTDGAFFEEFIVNQNFRRFTGIGSVYRDGKRMPLLYYFPKMFVGALPWSIVSVCTLAFMFKRIIRLKFRDGSVFLMFWLVTGFVFFSCSALKRGDYLLPLYPALGIMTAAAAIYGTENLPGLTRKWKYCWGVIAAAAGVFLLLNVTGQLIRAAQWGLRVKVRHLAKSDLENTILISEFINHHLIVCILITAAILAALYYLGRLMENKEWNRALMIFCGAVFIVYFSANAWITPNSAWRRTVKPLSSEIRKHIPSDAEVVFLGDFNTELLFFVNRPYDNKIKPDSKYLLMEKYNYRAFMKSKESRDWNLTLQTVENHQYPVYFFIRKNPK